MLAITVVTALSLLALPSFADDAASSAAVELAVEDAPEVEEAPADDDDHRIALVDTPRDRFGLVMWGLLFLAGAAAFINARKQLKGERDQASGEFRWR